MASSALQTTSGDAASWAPDEQQCVDARHSGRWELSGPLGISANSAQKM
jgi:hypothetical protein